jgi:mycothiol system anti-sigma-R factor
MSWMDELRRLLGRARHAEPPAAADPVTCGEAVERVFEWLDGELEPEAARRIGEHLEVCARCYPVVRFERAFRSALDRACRCQKTPEGVRAGVLEALEAEGLEAK